VVGQAAPLEFHPELLALSEQRVRSAATGAGEPSRLLLVGRGNSDPAAIATVHEYAQRLGRMCQLEAETAFVAAAEPKLPRKLRELAERQWPCVVIVPHLLFTGEVLHTIGEHVAAIAREFPATRWCLAEHLGPDARLTTAILDRAAAVDQHA
jgi:sirohydrochlorin ferrochelatase